MSDPLLHAALVVVSAIVLTPVFLAFFMLAVLACIELFGELRYKLRHWL